MPRAALVLASLLLLIATDAHAQIGRVAGTITDADGRPIKGATVIAENRDQAPSTFTSTSDARGRFSVLGLRRGLWVFTIQAPGFETIATRVDVVTTRPNPPLNVELPKGSASVAPGPMAGVDAKDLLWRIDAAVALEASGNHAAALAAYRELLTRAPALTSTYTAIGALHERLGDKDAAMQAYKRLLELDPQNVSARAAIDRLERR